MVRVMMLPPDTEPDPELSPDGLQSPYQPTRSTTDLFALLVCPVSLSSLIYNREAEELISLQSRYAYPIISGIPMMQTSYARQISEDEYAALKARHNHHHKQT